MSGELLSILQSLPEASVCLVQQPSQVKSIGHPSPDSSGTACRLLRQPLSSGWPPLSAPAGQHPAPRLAASKHSRTLSTQRIISDATFDTVLVGLWFGIHILAFGRNEPPQRQDCSWAHKPVPTPPCFLDLLDLSGWSREPGLGSQSTFRARLLCAKRPGLETPVRLADYPVFAGSENYLSFSSLARLKDLLGKTLGRSGAWAT